MNIVKSDKRGLFVGYFLFSLFILFLGIGGWFNQSKICWSEKRQISEQEIIASWVKGMSVTTDFYKMNSMIYYNFSNAHPGFLGSYRRNLKVIYKNYSDRYVETNIIVGVCGNYIGDQLDMGSSLSDIERNKKYLKTLILKNKI